MKKFCAIGGKKGNFQAHGHTSCCVSELSASWAHSTGNMAY